MCFNRAVLEDPVLMGKYEEFMVRRVLVLDPDTRWCPAPDCGYVLVLDPDTRWCPAPDCRCVHSHGSQIIFNKLSLSLSRPL